MLLHRLGVRNKSNTEGLVCAASSSSCRMDLTTFNNNNDRLFSCHTMGGTVRPSTDDKIDDVPFCLLENIATEDVMTGVKVV